jgi:tetratricopeptide repeat protein 35
MKVRKTKHYAIHINHDKLINFYALIIEWMVIEQVCLAAMDLHDSDLIKGCLTLLDNKFGQSLRVRRLKIMANMERRERYDDAMKNYESMITNDEANCNLYKRKISILIAQQRISEAAKELSEYLKKFMNDPEAWLELSNMYILEQEYYKAAFCIEELILTNPHNHLYYQRYAEIHYTINTLESLEIARSYFSQALKLNCNNLRALYGLLLTTSALASQPKLSSQKKKENSKLALWSVSQINKLYKQQSDQEANLSTLQTLFDHLQIS